MKCLCCHIKVDRTTGSVSTMTEIALCHYCCEHCKIYALATDDGTDPIDQYMAKGYIEMEIVCSKTDTSQIKEIPV